MGLTAGIVGVSSDRGVLLAFDQDAAFKPGSCTNQGDQMAVTAAPAGLGGLDELEHHGQHGGRTARVTGDLGAELYRGEVDSMGLVVRSLHGVSAVPGVVDLLQRLLRARLRGLR